MRIPPPFASPCWRTPLESGRFLAATGTARSARTRIGVGAVRCGRDARVPGDGGSARCCRCRRGREPERQQSSAAAAISGTIPGRATKRDRHGGLIGLAGWDADAARRQLLDDGYCRVPGVLGGAALAAAREMAGAALAAAGDRRTAPNGSPRAALVPLSGPSAVRGPRRRPRAPRNVRPHEASAAADASPPDAVVAAALACRSRSRAGGGPARSSGTRTHRWGWRHPISRTGRIGRSQIAGSSCT